MFWRRSRAPVIKNIVRRRAEAGATSQVAQEKCDPAWNIALIYPRAAQRMGAQQEQTRLGAWERDRVAADHANVRAVHNFRLDHRLKATAATMVKFLHKNHA